MDDGPKHETSLFKVMVIGTAISFGFLAAVIASMADFTGGNATFQFSYKSVVAFVLGAAAGWAFWRLIRHLANRDGSGRA